ncbi:MAG TPA: carbohydrate ABC transporter permease [Roseiflexaceae bacterium]|jgi:ABC-type glycerol-3-phosphate transport system permease component|nr:carbohydrate ABC transporter permease [Roseiflexaceae bacterium]
MSLRANDNERASTTGAAFSSVGQRATDAGRAQRAIRVFLYYGVLIAAVAAFMIPIIWLLLGSLKLNAEFRAYPIKILPRSPIWNNYYDALTLVPFFVYAGRSLLLALLYTVLVVISSAFAGFGFARHRAPGRNTLFILVVAMVMVPQIVTIIPQFMLYSRLGLVGTYWPWVLWGIAGSPFHIFLFRQFFAGFPKELEDAAEIDGCTRLRVFGQIFLPNAGPVLAASAIFAFQWVWGDFFLQSIFLNESHATLAMKLASAYVDPHGNPLYTQTLAAVVIYVLPLIVVFFLAQKQIVRGVVTTGLK